MPAPERIAIVLPELGSTRVQFSLWYVREGDPVFEGDRVAEVLIPGATYDIAAPASGRLVERQARANDALATGQVLGLIDT
jgi:pyruvate/2-oxoglutarate dehydrogenase complex dihydrolipoamide acyltransferase (E2) component